MTFYQSIYFVIDGVNECVKSVTWYTTEATLFCSSLLFSSQQVSESRCAMENGSILELGMLDISRTKWKEVGSLDR